VADAQGLRAVLEAAMAVRAVVVKRRRLFLWRGVRIHLDDVEDLGRFIELEAVAAPESDLTREHALVAELREALHVDDDRLCATGHATLLAPL
jgi:adenylate cyclase class IV